MVLSPSDITKRHRMNICVFCASSPAVKEAFKSDAYALGSYIAQEGHILIYGGATGGLMDSVAQGCADSHGEIVGVIPEMIVEKGRQSDLAQQLFIVEDMNERKALMKEHADLFVVLPGGYGTLDELFDVVASKMVGYHDKPIIVLNKDDYYRGLILQIETMDKEHLGHKLEGEMLTMCSTLESCKETIERLDH